MIGPRYTLTFSLKGGDIERHLPGVTYYTASKARRDFVEQNADTGSYRSAGGKKELHVILEEVTALEIIKTS